MFENIYKDKRVLITGHTGFKGSWLALWLTHLGANLSGYALNPLTEPNLYNVLDIEKNMADYKVVDWAIEELNKPHDKPVISSKVRNGCGITVDSPITTNCQITNGFSCS